jgi:predicted nucleic-acid-binding protein
MNRTDIRAGIDTSVVVRLLIGQPAELATIAFEYLAQIEKAGAAVFISNLVVSEAYYACHYHYDIPKGEVLRGLSMLLSKPTFVVHPALLNLLAANNLATSKPGFLDRLIHAEYSGSGLPLVTFEKAAERLPNTRLLSR